MSQIRAMEAYAQRATMAQEAQGMKNASLSANRALGAVQGLTQRPVSAAVIVSVTANAMGASQNAKSETKVKRAAASVTPGAEAYAAAKRLSGGELPSDLVYGEKPDRSGR